MLNIDIKIDDYDFKHIERRTKSDDSMEQLKKDYYIDVVTAVIWKRYEITSCKFDAFAQNCFYICDLFMDGLINENDERLLNARNRIMFTSSNKTVVYADTDSIKVKERGDKDGRH